MGTLHMTVMLQNREINRCTIVTQRARCLASTKPEFIYTFGEEFVLVVDFFPWLDIWLSLWWIDLFLVMIAWTHERFFGKYQFQSLFFICHFSISDFGNRISSATVLNYSSKRQVTVKLWFILWIFFKNILIKFPLIFR